MAAVGMEGEYGFLQDSQLPANMVGAVPELDAVEVATQREPEVEDLQEIAEAQVEPTEEVLDQPGEEELPLDETSGHEAEVKDGGAVRVMAAVKSRPKPKTVPEPPKPVEPLKELPMITREAQQAQKQKADKVAKMDGKRGDEGKVPQDGRKRANPKPKDEKPKRSKKAAAPAGKAEVPETVVEIEDEDGEDSKSCKKDLSEEFEAAAEETRTRKRKPSEPKAKAKSSRRKLDKTEVADKEREENEGKVSGKDNGKVADKKAENKKGKVTDKTKGKVTDSNKGKVTDKTQGKDETGEDKPKGKSTFAGRYCPAENEEAIQRFNVIKKVFQEAILPKVSGPISSLEAGNGNKTIIIVKQR